MKQGGGDQTKRESGDVGLHSLVKRSSTGLTASTGDDMEPSCDPHFEESDSAEDQCSICLSQFTVPRMLPCIHSFCHECLQQHITRSHNPVTDTFRCPLCRRLHHPLRPLSLPVTSWAYVYPINIFLEKTCAYHNTSTDAICFCHDVNLCIRCLFQRHRNCCISINPSKLAKFIAYFNESLDSVSLWQSRLNKIWKKENHNFTAAYFVSLECCMYVTDVKISILRDLMNIARETLESDTMRFESVNFRLIEHRLISTFKPRPFAEFQLAKQLLIQSAESSIEHKILADDKLIIGLVNEASIFLISPLGGCICEMQLLGRIKSIDIWGKDLVIALLKLSTSTLEGSYLQYLKCSDTRLISVGSYHLDRTYSQTVAFSETKVVASYYDSSWVIDVLKVENNTVVKVGSFVLGSDLHCFIHSYDSACIIYTNNIEIYRVNLENKDKVCLLPTIRTQRNSIERISHLAANQYDIYFADIINSSIYKMTRNGKGVTLFLHESNEHEKIVDFQFNSSGHLLICLEFPGCFIYRLYKGEDFIGWDE